MSKSQQGCRHWCSTTLSQEAFTVLFQHPRGRKPVLYHTYEDFFSLTQVVVQEEEAPSRRAYKDNATLGHSCMSPSHSQLTPGFLGVAPGLIALC